MIPHWMWTLWGSVVVLVIIWGLTIEMIPISRGLPHYTLSWILWEHVRLPAVAYFALGFLNIGLTTWAMLHFASNGKWGI
ncbi:MAG: hypothetical protein EHM35_05135 [Planctomycetaceae bacterium]|nr:MAG: hypothetical protein EHM35_05135 [Planctomycetaceae bacterium]